LTPDAACRLAQELKRYRHDPLRFVLYAYPWGVPGTALEGRTGPEPWQREVLEYIGEELRAGRFPIRIAVASGHGIGKSALMAWIRGWSMTTLAHTKGRVTANTETQLRTTTLPEFAKWHGMQIGREWFEGNFSYRYKHNPAHGETWRFDAVAWSETRTEAFAGLHNAGNRIVVLYDEASAIADTVWETTEGALTDANTEILWLAFGNPTRATGRFAECWGRHRASWWTKRVDSRTVSFTDKRLIDSWIDAYGEDSDFVRVRVKGERPRAAATQFIPFDLAEGAATREAECWPSDAMVIGVDVARFGDDQSVIVRRRGRDARTWAPLKYRGLDTMQLAARVAEINASDRPDAIFVDEGGVGGGVVDRLRQLGVPVTGVNFGAKPDSGTLQELGGMGERYANKRAEMWGTMRAWLPRGAIPNDRELIDDLTGVEYGYNADNAIQLERKEDMKKRGLSSPDIADALALTFAYPVVARGAMGARSKPRTFDPFKEYAA
jgi:hypothetical protein